MSFSKAASPEYWIIGYGNPQRRDDGIGPYIINRLQPLLASRGDVHLLDIHQLAPDLIDALKTAQTILFVDATMARLARGYRWVGLQPELRTSSGLTHQVSPAGILGWLQTLYQRNPLAWLISVEGSDFGLGSGLSSKAQKRAEQVIGEITEFVLTQVEKPAG